MSEKFSGEKTSEPVELVQVPLHGESVSIQEPLLTTKEVEERFGIKGRSLLATIAVPVRNERTATVEGIHTENKTKTLFAFRAERDLAVELIQQKSPEQYVKTYHGKGTVTLVDETSVALLAEAAPDEDGSSLFRKGYRDLTIGTDRRETLGTSGKGQFFTDEDIFVSPEHFDATVTQDGELIVSDRSMNGTVVTMADQESVQVVYQ